MVGSGAPAEVVTNGDVGLLPLVGGGQNTISDNVGGAQCRMSKVEDATLELFLAFVFEGKDILLIGKRFVHAAVETDVRTIAVGIEFVLKGCNFRDIERAFRLVGVKVDVARIGSLDVRDSLQSLGCAVLTHAAHEDICDSIVVSTIVGILHQNNVGIPLVADGLHSLDGLDISVLCSVNLLETVAVANDGSVLGSVVRKSRVHVSLEGAEGVLVNVGLELVVGNLEETFILPELFDNECLTVKGSVECCSSNIVLKVVAEELDGGVAQTGPVATVLRAVVFDTEGERAVGDLSHHIVLVTPGKECLTAALYTMKDETKGVGILTFIGEDGQLRILAREPAVFVVNGLAIWHHAVNGCLDVSDIPVGIEHGGVVEAGPIISRTATAIHAHKIVTVLQSREGLPDVEGALSITELSRTHAVVGIIVRGKDFAVPTFGA